MAGLGLCMTAGVFQAFVAAQSFTLAWTHSIEKVRWEEDYRIVDNRLELTQARVRGSGAGMEPPPGALLRDGAWHYRPRIDTLPALVLARSDYTADYELCLDGACRPLTHWIPVAPSPTRIEPCRQR
jgi:hypothetical protein